MRFFLKKSTFGEKRIRFFEKSAPSRYGPGPDTWGREMDFDIVRHQSPKPYPLWKYDYYLSNRDRKKSQEISVAPPQKTRLKKIGC